MFDPTKNIDYKIDYEKIRKQLTNDLKLKGFQDYFESSDKFETYISNWFITLKKNESKKSEFKPQSTINEFFQLPIIFDNIEINITLNINKILSQIEKFDEFKLFINRQEIFGFGPKYFTFDKTIKVNNKHQIKNTPLIAIEWFDPKGKFTIADGNHRLNIKKFNKHNLFEIIILTFENTILLREDIFFSKWDAAFYTLEYELNTLHKLSQDGIPRLDPKDSLSHLF
ncbi:MAG: hypothetical protein ABF709_10325 [Leuconostoc pseudomesenteroides]|uniref:hypothetical protein n=1 Tax=Leuconostoc pseudomesenteroides TaxID=33968 RepID=UPI0039EC619E